MNNKEIKPISVAVKVMLIETLHDLEIRYSTNFKEYQKAIEEERSKEEINRMLIREYEGELDYWRFEYAKINQIKRLIKDLPECPGPAYKITEETADVTVYEAEKGGDTPPEYPIIDGVQYIPFEEAGYP